MQTATMTFNELEWRSDAVTASAGQVISEIARNSKLHYRVLLDLRSVNDKMLDLLRHLHSPESIKNLESATPDKLQELVDKMKNVHGKIRILIAHVESWDLGYWRRFYRSRLETMATYNQELAMHAEAFATPEKSLILLSKRDQEFLLESLMAPAEPNDALRRAVARR
jgi:uncharacterized protein YicC (UPF0701 family)